MSFAFVRNVLLLMVFALVSAIAAAQGVVSDLENENAEKILMWLQIVTSVIGTFSLIAAATPTKRDDRIVGKLLKVVDFLGANFGAAKNKGK